MSFVNSKWKARTLPCKLKNSNVAYVFTRAKVASELFKNDPFYTKKAYPSGRTWANIF